MTSATISLIWLRDSVAAQLDDLLERHGDARERGSGWSGLAADIASLSEALVLLDRRLEEKQGRR